MSATGERRQRQRFAALRDGKPCIEIILDGQRLPLTDLSLDGFSLSARFPLPEGEFDFSLRLIDGFGDKITGCAQVMNRVGDAAHGQTGCRFVSLSPGGEQTLQEWLVVIVICSASVRLSSREAEAIVQGPSLI